jgi:3-methyladenine DNA glycosylase AlkD
MKQYLNEVEKIIKNLPRADKPEKWKAKNYVGAGKSKLTFLDIKIPDVRDTFKKGFSFYHPKSKNIDTEKTLKIFDYIWKNSDYFEVLLLSSYFVSTLTVEQKIKFKKILFSWLKKIDNWALSDELSAHYSQMLEADTRVISEYRKWNRSENPWERRQSLVGLIFYSCFRRSPLSWQQIKLFLMPLLADNDYFVQKGVGWCLRESFNLYPVPVYKYIFTHAGTIHPAAWYACNEKLTLSQKAELKKKRSADKIKIKKRA